VAVPEVSHADYAQQVASIRERLGATSFDAAWEAGRRLSVDQVIATALAANASLSAAARGPVTGSGYG